jgi:hypothetical protein
MNIKHPYLLPAVLATTLFSTAPVLHAATLQGSHEKQYQQNAEADREGLSRIDDDAHLKLFEQAGLLVPLPEGKTIVIDSRLAPKWRWCRPWVAEFLRSLSREYFAKFKKPLRINSAVRTIEYQKQLCKRNANAAAPDGDRRSSHLTGSTVDIAKKTMSPAERRWMRERLIELESNNAVEAIEENYQSVFHVMVFRTGRPDNKILAGTARKH